MSIPGNVFDHQHGQRDSDELHNDSRNLAISLAILRSEELRIVGAKNHCNQCLYLAFRRQISLMSMTNHARVQFHHRYSQVVHRTVKPVH